MGSQIFDVLAPDELVKTLGAQVKLDYSSSSNCVCEAIVNQALIE